MSSIKVERDVDAAPEAVWGIITDLTRTAEVISGIKDLKRLDAGTGFGVGTEWQETRTMMNRDSTETMQVTSIDEGRSYTVESDAYGAHYTSVMAVEPKGAGCHLSMTFGAEATSVGARIMGVFSKVFEGSTKKALAQDLDDIAAVAERQNAG
jgi:carbon monoxide dehydrogenase subunit G